MNIVIKHNTLSGNLHIPSSKSAMQRACAAALLTPGISILNNPGKSNDDLAALSIIEQLGAQVVYEKDQIHITSNGIETIKKTNCHAIDVHESGLSARMFTPIAAISSNKIQIKGSGTLTSRSLEFFWKHFPYLQIEIEQKSKYIPFHIKGPLQPTNIIVEGNESSQYITGLLMAYSAAVKSDTTIQVNNLLSKPYIELTLSIMQQFEMNMPEVHRLASFHFSKGESFRKNIEYTVESDWSSASFWLVGAAISGNICLKGLNTYSTQADASILEVLDLAEIDYNVNDEDEIFINKSIIKNFKFDATDCPDLFPPLVVLASHANGISEIIGVHRLINKESNRKEALIQEFKKLNITISINRDVMYIQGGQVQYSKSLWSHNDHRIAMALAIATLSCTDRIEISDAECVNKSYPEFWNHLHKLGAELEYKEY